MKADQTLLSEGIMALRQSDANIEKLIAPHSQSIISLLDRYITEIELFNPAYGLVGTQNTKELIIKHILDSLAPLGIISRLLTEHTGVSAAKPQIADAGSGAGLPGIPLAIVMQNCDFTLIERMKRRAGFLLNTKASLQLSNIMVEEGELEKTKPEHFTLITFRAFKPLDKKLLKSLFNACAPGGVIAAYKGRREKIEQETEGLINKSKKGDVNIQPDWDILPYNVPFLNEERHLLIIRKTANLLTERI